MVDRSAKRGRDFAFFYRSIPPDTDLRNVPVTCSMIFQWWTTANDISLSLFNSVRSQCQSYFCLWANTRPIRSANLISPFGSFSSSSRRKRRRRREKEREKEREGGRENKGRWTACTRVCTCNVPERTRYRTLTRATCRPTTVSRREYIIYSLHGHCMHPLVGITYFTGAYTFSSWN